MTVIDTIVGRFRVLDFRFLNAQDGFGHASVCFPRPYDYVSDFIDLDRSGSVHSISGTQCHADRDFSRRLADSGFEVTISEVLRGDHSSGPHFSFSIVEREVRKFDTVICVFALEGAGGDALGILLNLMEQVAEGGRLIITFDSHLLGLARFERMFGSRLGGRALTWRGSDAGVCGPECGDSSIVGLVLERVSDDSVSILDAPKVSIILPTYNRAEMLPRCLGSMFDQDFFDWELIVVDDGSADRTQEVLRSYSDDRMKVIRQANKKLPGALNVGHAAARGRYMTWVSDDCWAEREWLGELVRCMDALDESHACVFTDYIYTRNGSSKWWRTGLQKMRECSSIGASFLYRRSVYEAIGGYKQEVLGAEDWEFFLRIASRYRLFHLDGTAKYHYDIYDDSMTVRIADTVTEAIRNVKEMYADVSLFFEP